MADGGILTLMALSASAAGTGMQAYGAHQEGKTQDAWHRYNAAVAEQQAEAERIAARDEALQHRREGDRLQARQRVAAAKSGDWGSPTLLSVMGDTVGEIERDALLIERGGRLKGQQLESQARMDRFMGKSARRGARWQAGSSLLTGMGQTYLNYKAVT